MQTRNEYVRVLIAGVIGLIMLGAAHGGILCWDGANTGNSTNDGGSGTWDASTTTN